MKVTVKKGDVSYVCTSEDQLHLFIEAGYVEEQPEAETPKAAAPKRSKKSK